MNDIVQDMVNTKSPLADDDSGEVYPARLYSIGNNQPEDSLYFVETPE